MGRSSRCADCGATVVVTRAKPQFRGGAMVLVCRQCAGVDDPVAIPRGGAAAGDEVAARGQPPPESDDSDYDYDEVLVGIADDVDDIYDDVEVVVDPAAGEPPAPNGNVFHGAHDASVSGAVDVEERAPRQRDPTLPPVVIDKAQ